MDIEYLSYLKGNKTEFDAKMDTIAEKLGIDKNWLYAVMWCESRMNPKARNSTTAATGLIQFMPKTAIALKTSISELYRMSAINQLDYVYAYLAPYKGRMHSVEDVYCVIFFPRALNQPSGYILHTEKTSALTIAKQNPGFDMNKDGQITKAEFYQWIDIYIKKKRNQYVIEKVSKISIPLLIAAGAAGYFFAKLKKKKNG